MLKTVKKSEKRKVWRCGPKEGTQVVERIERVKVKRGAQVCESRKEEDEQRTSASCGKRRADDGTQVVRGRDE